MKYGRKIADCINFLTFFPISSLMTIAVTNWNRFPNTINTMLYARVLRVIVHRVPERNRNLKLSRPTNGLKKPSLKL